MDRINRISGFIGWFKHYPARYFFADPVHPGNPVSKRQLLMRRAYPPTLMPFTCDHYEGEAVLFVACPDQFLGIMEPW
jgi:hypothetical protein